MKLWEYRVVTLQGSITVLTDILNEYGRAGWKLISANQQIDAGQRAEGKFPVTMLFFRRTM